MPVNVEVPARQLGKRMRHRRMEAKVILIIAFVTSLPIARSDSILMPILWKTQDVYVTG